VLATVSLSDAPVEGELVLSPVEDETAWSFAVDLDDDGRFDDARGDVAVEQRIPYRFTEEGVHPIRVRFEQTSRRIDVERLIAVNDPDAFVLEERVQFDPNRTQPEGIAVTRDNAHLFVGGGSHQNVLRLETEDLTTSREISLVGLPNSHTLEGMALNPAEDRLFIINKSSAVTVLSAPSLAVIKQIQGTGATFFVEVLDQRRIVVSGAGSPALVDVETEDELSVRETRGAFDIELSPERQTVALTARDPGRVILLDSENLEELWLTELPVGLPSGVVFHPSGDRIYVLGSDLEALWLFVLRAADGEVVQRTRIGPTSGRDGVANPTATTHDGRFVVFPTGNGAYFVDTSLDIPRLLLNGNAVGLPGNIGVGCCNVAAPESENVVYIVNFIELHKVRILG